MSRSFIDLNNVEFEVENKVKILSGVNLQIEKGECVVLQGVSGSGKTTLLSLLAGLERPTSGDIVVEEQHIAKMPQHHLSNYLREKVAIVFQNFNLIKHLSVYENIEAVLVPTKLSTRTVKELVKTAMKKAQIEHKKDALAATLSGGEMQRCSIARAIVNTPDIILCDEPTANLDRANSLAFVEMLQKLHEFGHTVVVATHDPLFDNLAFVTKRVYMEDGSIVHG